LKCGGGDHTEMDDGGGGLGFRGVFWGFNIT